jgi:hypothetical protein
MQPDLVRSDIYWRMEGEKLVGELQIIKIATGERTTIDVDGSVIKDQVEPPKLEWCDKCQSWKPIEFGRYDGAHGLTMLWSCLECK